MPQNQIQPRGKASRESQRSLDPHDGKRDITIVWLGALNAPPPVSGTPACVPLLGVLWPQDPSPQRFAAAPGTPSSLSPGVTRLRASKGRSPCGWRPRQLSSGWQRPLELRAESHLSQAVTPLPELLGAQRTPPLSTATPRGHRTRAEHVLDACCAKGTKGEVKG